MKKRALKPGTLVEYRDAQVSNSIANGRQGRIVRVCSKQGGAYQYVVEIISCPDNWKPEHKAQQIGKAHFWWDCDFVVVPNQSGLHLKEYREHPFNSKEDLLKFKPTENEIETIFQLTENIEKKKKKYSPYMKIAAALIDKDESEKTSVDNVELSEDGIKLGLRCPNCGKIHPHTNALGKSQLKLGDKIQYVCMPGGCYKRSKHDVVKM